MKGDFTRQTFRPENHYSRVLQQQGRVSLDADWNEALDILTYRGRMARIDIIGPCCAPQGNAGFEITVADGNLHIGPGHYYVDGILCENKENHLFTEQTDVFPNAALPTTAGRYLAYLDVWERHITALEAPEIREVALGGPDTATRVQVIAQVKLEPIPGDAVCNDFGHGWQPAGVASTGQLEARAEPDDEDPNPCIVPPSAGYRRLENQLYRIEIHAPGPLGTATFKWSRENGSVVTEWVDQDGDVLIVSSSGRDANLGFASTNWIELIDDTRELQGRRGILVQLQNVEGRELTIDPSTIDDPDDPTATSVDINAFAPTRKIRRWESDGAQTVDIPASNDGYLPLEGGVEVRFGPLGSEFQTGDYWLIPARTNIGDILWPTNETTNEPLAESRHGIHHHYCSLALLQLGDSGWTRLDDCRHLFPPLCGLPSGRGDGCCTVTVGDGSLSTGDFDSIQEAVNALEGLGKVCILPGTYRLPQAVMIEGGEVIISGCGRQTHIIAESQQPAFIARNANVRFDSLMVSAASPAGAIVLQNCQLSEVRDCFIRNFSQESTSLGNRLAADQPLHYSILSHRLRLAAFLEERSQGLGPAITVIDGRQISIENNTLLGRPAVQLQALEANVRGNVAKGGIWVWDGSAMVEIADNKLQGAIGAGIVLGGITGQNDLLNTEAGVRFVTIRNNRIANLTDNGIGSLTEQDGIVGLGDLEDITIVENFIAACAWQPTQVLDGDGVGGIVLSNVSRLRILNNEILYNGPRGQPACGILVQECEGLEVIDNQIVENGAPDIAPQRCIDFRDRDDEADDRPLVVEGTTFRNVNLEPNGSLYRIESNAMGAGVGSGLQCHNGLVMTLPEAVNTVSLLLLGSPITVRAMDRAGNVLAVSSDNGSEPRSSPRTLTITATGIEVLHIEPMFRLWLLQLCTGAAIGYQAGIAALFVYDGEYETPEANFPLPSHVPGRAALVVHGNSVVCPAGQALWALGIGRILVNDNIFTSRGEYVQPVPDRIDDAGNNDYWLNLAQLGRCVSIVDLGVALELVNLLTGQLTGVRSHYLSSTSLVATARAARQVPPGYIQCHDNQMIFSMSPVEPRVVLPAVFLASFDDIGVHDNQIRSDISRAIQIADILVFGATVQVQANRLTEQLNTAYASCMSFGFVNHTASNIATHCIFAAGGGPVIDQPNQIINGAACPNRQGRVGAVLVARGR